jgi:uncharacterized protein (TIGR00297 family)
MLSLSGAFCAVFIGTLVLAAGGWTAAILLVLFFISSSLFTRLAHLARPDLQASFAKGSRRDARQVLANGALPAVFAALGWAYPEVNWLPLIVGSLAAATADTWATEWGVLAKRRPRRITDWQLVPAGTSGGITPLGTLGSAVGALVIAAAASLLERSPEYLLVGVLAGVFGSALDSLLGATIQVQYHCQNCGVQTEQHPVHRVCDTHTSYLRGVLWVDNDVVNLIANGCGALIAVLWIILHR